MRLTIRYILIFLFVLSLTEAQAQVIRWKGTFGGSSYECAYSCLQTYDGGYITVGSTGSYSSSVDVYLFKTDSVGKMKWFKNFGGLGIDVGRSIKQTADSGFVIAGYTNSPSTGYDVYVIRTDKSGDTLWTKKYGGSNWDFGYSIFETYDSGFVVAGGTYSYGVGDEDFYLLRLNKMGDTLWTKTYGGTNEDEASCVLESSNDSGFVLVGKTKSFADIMGSAYVVKTDKDGTMISDGEYGGSDNDYLNSIVEAPFINGFIAVGGTLSYGPDEDVYMARLNYSCDTVWTKAQLSGGSLSDKDFANSVAISQYDSCFALIGTTQSGSPGYDDVYLFKFDSTGYYQTATTYGTLNQDRGYCISPTKDRGFIICGQTDTTATGFHLPNAILIKVDSAGFSAGPFLNYIPSIQNTNFNILVYPNPISDRATIQVNSLNSLNVESISFRIIDLAGKEIEVNTSTGLFSKNSTHSAAVSIITENLNRGTYILEVNSGTIVIGRTRLVKN